MNLGNDASVGSMSLNSKITEAYETSHVETDIKASSFSDYNLNIRIAAQELSTYRIKTSTLLSVGNK